MKTIYILPLLTIPAVLAFLSGCASKPVETAPAPVTQVTTVVQPATPAPTLTTSGVTPPRDTTVYNYDQQLYSTAVASTALPQQQHAGEIIDAFRPTYEKLSKPRFVVYVNRDLMGTAKPSVKTQPAPSGNGTVVTTNALADKQTTRDIERITARPFRFAGATIADQPTATSLASADIKSAEAREALKKVADIAIEVLLSSRTISTPATISGESTNIAIPDVQMTAIRLSDAAIIGQATAADIVNQLPAAALGSMNVQDVLEATSLNLMSDITATAK